jgi:hypothetical protein
MGRGRAKAKQQKVARDLKYNTPSTDLSALQNELSGHASDNPQPSSKWDDDDDYEDDGRWASAR